MRGDDDGDEDCGSLGERRSVGDHGDIIVVVEQQQR